MTKLSMHDDLPFDETTTPPRVSTGELPIPEEIRRLVTQAYERYRGDHRGTVADYIPVLAGASPDLFGIAVVGPRGRSFEIGDVAARFSIQSPSMHSFAPCPSAAHRICTCPSDRRRSSEKTAGWSRWSTARWR